MYQAEFKMNLYQEILNTSYTHLVIPRVAIRCLSKGRYDEAFAGEDVIYMAEHELMCTNTNFREIFGIFSSYQTISYSNECHQEIPLS